VFTWCMVHAMAGLLWEEADTESWDLRELCSNVANRELLHDLETRMMSELLL